jgi:hypothetical protein
MGDMPDDPFMHSDFVSPIRDGNLLWAQLVDMPVWADLQRAINALDEADLRRIVFAQLAAFYGQNDQIVQRPR